MTEPFGLLNVLKPPGMSSHDVVGAVRRLVGTRRVGHGGTLDPAAAGVMTVAVGKATRLLGYLRDDKAYRAVVRFGLATDSADAEGKVTARADASGLTADALAAALPAFRGEITQRPPMTSAVHVDGKRLYELARAGVTLPDEAIPTRQVTIHRLELVDLAGPTARLDVHCSAGTYIRSLAVDLGATLGLPACLEFLLRTAAGDCKLAAAQTLEELAEAPCWMPEDAWLGHLALQVIDEHEISEIGFGRRIAAQQAYEQAVRLRGPDGRLVALATLAGSQLQPVLVF
ncbi:MAG: tRNA pseudouridine 55 synthase [Cyanobacteria bacterium RYN_339]|nr:tRNA pseudouridine 55 synthase [Cyanobacteria bacterium RYN_339]